MGMNLRVRLGMRMEIKDGSWNWGFRAKESGVKKDRSGTVGVCFPAQLKAISGPPIRPRETAPSFVRVRLPTIKNENIRDSEEK